MDDQFKFQDMTEDAEAIAFFTRLNGSVQLSFSIATNGDIDLQLTNRDFQALVAWLQSKLATD